MMGESNVAEIDIILNKILKDIELNYGLDFGEQMIDPKDFYEIILKYKKGDDNYVF
jgi:hypothetical protein